MQDEELGAYRQRMQALNTYCNTNNLPQVRVCVCVCACACVRVCVRARALVESQRALLTPHHTSVPCRHALESGGHAQHQLNAALACAARLPPNPAGPEAHHGRPAEAAHVAAE
jgi:hypothetical protein